MFTEKQRKKFFQIPSLWAWFLIRCTLTWCLTFFLLAAFIYVTDVGDAIAIFDGYPIFVPMFGLCFKTGQDWKNRYFICLLLIVTGVIVNAQPGFIFGYTQDVNTTNQLIGCLLALSAAVGLALAIVTAVMVKKLAYLDLLKQQHAHVAKDGVILKCNRLTDETPLINKNNETDKNDYCTSKKINQSLQLEGQNETEIKGMYTGISCCSHLILFGFGSTKFPYFWEQY